MLKIVRCTHALKVNNSCEIFLYFRDVPAKSDWKLSVKVKAKRVGLEQFSVTFDSQEVPDITGRAEVQVK